MKRKDLKKPVPGTSSTCTTPAAPPVTPTVPTLPASTLPADPSPATPPRDDYVVLHLDQAEVEVIMDNEPSSSSDEDEDNYEDDEEPEPAPAAAAAALQPPKQKRRRKSEQVILPEETEKILGDWLEFEVPYLFDKGMPEHKDKVKIAAVLAEKAASLDPPITAKKLETWLSSIRTRFGRISREKIGQGAKRYTEREQWILHVFRFLKPHIVRQRKPRVLGFPKSASAAAAAQPAPANGRVPTEPEVVPVPQPTPPTATDARSEEEEEDTTPAMEEPRRPKNARPAGEWVGAHPLLLLRLVAAWKKFW